MTVGWLTQFDVEQPYRARRVELLHTVSCGAETDYLWVRLDPPIAPGEAANEEPLEFVLLAPRHAGHPLALPLEEPTHVHVCTVRGVTDDLAMEVDPADVQIRHWGMIAPESLVPLM